MVLSMGAGASGVGGAGQAEVEDLLRELLAEVRKLRELAGRQTELLAAILETQQRIEQEIIRGFL